LAERGKEFGLLLLLSQPQYKLFAFWLPLNLVPSNKGVQQNDPFKARLLKMVNAIIHT